MAGHTPGPWFSEKSTADFWYITLDPDAYGRPIGQTWSAHCGTGSEEANARLIASAPDLLEALKGAVEALEQTLRWSEGWECSEADLLGSYRAAIAKATGAPQ